MRVLEGFSQSLIFAMNIGKSLMVDFFVICSMYEWFWQKVDSAQDFEIVEDVSTSYKRMVVMDGWGGALVTLSSGVGLGLRYVYIAYVWIAWPPLVEDATIQASADTYGRCFQHEWQIAACHVPLCFTWQYTVRDPSKSPGIVGLHFSDVDTVWVEKKHGVFLGSAWAVPNITVCSIASFNSRSIVVFANCQPAWGATSTTTSETTSQWRLNRL